jgi:hypothetical protein
LKGVGQDPGSAAGEASPRKLPANTQLGWPKHLGVQVGDIVPQVLRALVAAVAQVPLLNQVARASASSRSIGAGIGVMNEESDFRNGVRLRKCSWANLRRAFCGGPFSAENRPREEATLTPLLARENVDAVIR